MSEDDYLAIGNVLHSGAWQFHSGAPLMAESFCRELEQSGFRIVNNTTSDSAVSPIFLEEKFDG